MNTKKWVQYWFYIALSLACIPYLFVYLFLTANYENNSFAEIVQRQIFKQSIYGTALNQNTFLYKLELVKAKKPEIVALGSSRVMQFREDGFKSSFVNAGGAMNHLNEGYMFLNEMYKFHKPKYIILGMDFWWFNEKFIQPEAFPYHENNGKTIGYEKILKTFQWLASGKVNISTINNIFDNNEIINEFTQYDNMGFAAITNSTGFRPDGSYFYAYAILGIQKSWDEKFQSILSRIDNEVSPFQYGERVSENRIREFKKILKLIQKNKTELIIFIPPVSNTVFKKMQKEKYAYIDEFRSYIKKLPLENYDYHDPSILTSNDCECIDGFHGGDIMYQRILKDFYSHDSSIKNHLKIEIIQEDINTFNGHVLKIFENDKFKYNEIDFLKLGCDKKI